MSDYTAQTWHRASQRWSAEDLLLSNHLLMLIKQDGPYPSSGFPTIMLPASQRTPMSLPKLAIDRSNPRASYMESISIIRTKRLPQISVYRERSPCSQKPISAPAVHIYIHTYIQLQRRSGSEPTASKPNRQGSEK